MLKEYIDFIKKYMNLVQIKTSYFVLMILSAIFYKGFYVLVPLIGSLIVKYLQADNVDMVYLCLLFYFISYLIYNLALYLNYKVYAFNMSYYYEKIQKRVLNKLIAVDSGFNNVISKGRLMNSINGHIIEIGDMNDEISETITGFLQVFVVFVIVGIKNIWVCLVLIIYSFIYLYHTVKYDRIACIYHEKVTNLDDRFSNILSQIATGIQEIKTFNMLDKLLKKVKLIQNRFNKNYVLKRKAIENRDINVRYINYSFRIIFYLIMIYFIYKGKATLDILVLVIAYHGYIIEYISDLMENLETIRETNIKVNRINDILNYSSSYVEYGNTPIDELFGVIEFKNVSYSINNTKILKNINLKLEHNKVTAIVGEPGSGKTTLFNLILRIIEQDKGVIKLDNIDIRKYSKDDYSKSISIINQKPFIFNMSIKANLDLVDTNHEHQIKACKKAGIHNFIESLPKGYNTILIEDGKNVSGGQKQMISIARTILTDSDILLLDDITTSLDPDTALLVPKLIDNLKDDHTILMITKKPDLMKIADRIIVLNDGKIVGDGTHEELIKENEIYQILQSRKSPSKIGVFNNVQ